MDDVYNKVPISRSRPLTCSPPPFIVTAAAVATLQSVNVIFTKPKFAFKQVCFHAEWRENFAAEVFSFQKYRRRRVELNRSIRFKQSEISVAIRRRRTVELTWGETANKSLNFNGRRSYKVAVSPSRPMNCVRHEVA